MEDEDVNNVNVCTDLHISELTYYEKTRAIHKLDFALGLEVYETDEKSLQYFCSFLAGYLGQSVYDSDIDA